MCQALAGAGKEARAFAQWLLTREVASFKARHLEQRRRPEREIEERAPKHVEDLLALLEAAAVIEADAGREDLLAFLVTPATALPVMSVGALLQKCRESRRPAEVRALGLGVLYRYAVTSLQEALAAPPRSPDDWSIAPPPGCACALCKELSIFLSDRDRVEHAWPLAKERRQHIHGVIGGHGLPVTHVTTRSGRPYTLVLKKQKALFERDEAQRARRKVLLSWLRRQRASFDDDKT